ncbi:putative membrane-bound protein [Bacillus phage vB_BveM-Goe7]|nr:putative membrane-bound protein [Bacillus phage vB_BveM-Goe7]QDP43277.1 putative membrane-bound protein [Bacillus phage vB_BveM-Goe7]
MLKKAYKRMNMYFFGEEEVERSSEVLYYGVLFVLCPVVVLGTVIAAGVLNPW